MSEASGFGLEVLTSSKFRTCSMHVTASLQSVEQIHDTKPTICSNLSLGYSYYNIALNVPTCFGPQGSIIRESNKVTT